MSFWGKIFGTDKAVEKTIDHVAKGIDKLFYTSEEKAADAAAATTEARQFLIRWMESTQGQNLARRLLALCCTGVWLLMYLIAAVQSVIAPWLPEYSEAMMNSARVAAGWSDSMGGEMMLILGFYFAAPHLSSIVGPAVDAIRSKKAKDNL